MDRSTLRKSKVAIVSIHRYWLNEVSKCGIKWVISQLSSRISSFGPLRVALETDETGVNW